jgi:cell wall-associated NlpC family hydrolase
MKNVFSFIVFTALLLTSFSLHSQINDSEEEPQLNFDERPTPLPQNNTAYVDNIISFAKTFLGTPYLSSGASPTGFDCSGFVSYVLGNFGFDIIHSSYGMAEYGKTVKLSEVKPGDLMFFKGSNAGSNRIGHVAMVVEVNPIDGIKFIHASTSKGIAIDRFNGSKYYVPRYITTKRLDYGNP